MPQAPKSADSSAISDRRFLRRVRVAAPGLFPCLGPGRSALGAVLDLRRPASATITNAARRAMPERQEDDAESPFRRLDLQATTATVAQLARRGLAIGDRGAAVAAEPRREDGREPDRGDHGGEDDQAGHRRPPI